MNKRIEIKRPGSRVKSILYVLLIYVVFSFFSCNDRQLKEPIEKIYSCSDSSDLPNYPKNFVKRESSNDYLKNEDLRSGFSLKSLNIANAYGIIPLLKKLVKMKKAGVQKNNTHATGIEMNSLILRLNGAIEFASIDISGSASEMHCYAERMSDFVRILQNRERDSIKNYTLLSILVAASFTVLSGGVQWQSDSVQSAVNFVGGFSAGYLGYKATTYSAEIQFIPEKNVLAEFWNSPSDSSVFSEPLWHLINLNQDMNNINSSLRKELIHHWIQADYLGEIDSQEREEAIATLFGSEKKQNIDQLILIRDMNKQIGISIQLLLQDIKLLDREIDLLSETQTEIQK